MHPGAALALISLLIAGFFGAVYTPLWLHAPLIIVAWLWLSSGADDIGQIFVVFLIIPLFVGALIGDVYFYLRLYEVAPEVLEAKEFVMPSLGIIDWLTSVPISK